jgi:hypothetical protein
MPEYLKFKTNVPEVIALKFKDGLPTKSQIDDADQVMFTLVDGRRMYLNPYVAQLIAEKGIAPNRTFSIGKFEVKNGGGQKAIQWKVEPVTGGQVSREELATPPAPAASLQEETAAAVTQQTNNNKPPLDGLMQRALLEAVDAAHAAEQHATSIGFSLRWSSDDISRVAISLFIHRAGGRV